MSLKDISNDEDIKKLIHTFYGRVEKNERLGYIFNDVAAVDWESHLPIMIDFWSNMLFRTGRYAGQPFQKHMPLPIEKADFEIWYNLFTNTVDELFEGERATFAKTMAARIASAFTIRMQMEGKFD